MTIYVLEGPDLAGKTTLAEEIEKQHRSRGDLVFRRKLSQPKRDATQLSLFHTYFEEIRNAASIDEPTTAVIFDRLHVGEWIYGHHKRGNSLLTWAQIEALDNLLDSLKAVKLFVDVDYETLSTRFRTRGEDYVSLTELANISDAYRDTLHRHNDTRSPDLYSWKRVFMSHGEVPDVVAA